MDFFSQFFQQLFGFNTTSTAAQPEPINAAMAVADSPNADDWFAKGFGNQTPEWAPWHPEFEWTPVAEREAAWMRHKSYAAPPQTPGADVTAVTPQGAVDAPTPEDARSADALQKLRETWAQDRRDTLRGADPRSVEALRQASERSAEPLSGLSRDPALVMDGVGINWRSGVEGTPTGGPSLTEPSPDITQEQVDNGVISSVPPAPTPQPASRSGKALPAPMRLGAMQQEDTSFTAAVRSAVGPRLPRSVVNFKFASEAPTSAERAAIRRSGGIVVNLDTNWAPPGKATTPMVVIPDGSTPEQRKAAEAYAAGIAAIYKEKLGVEMKPKVLTRSENGRGRNDTIHTEPFSVNDTKAVDYFIGDDGKRRHAQLLRETFGKLPGVHFAMPHDPTGRAGKRKDVGAVGPRGSETDLAKIVLAELQNPSADPVPTNVASADDNRHPIWDWFKP